MYIEVTNLEINVREMKMREVDWYTSFFSEACWQYLIEYPNIKSKAKDSSEAREIL